MSLKAARLLFASSSRALSGTFLLFIDSAPSPPTEIRIELEQGWVHALGLAQRLPRPEEELLALFHSNIIDAKFVADEKATRRGRCQPFHPASVVRNYVEHQQGREAAQTLRERATGKRLCLNFRPHTSCLGFDERPVINFMENSGARGLTLAELEQARITSAKRIDHLLAFLEAAGAITFEQDAANPYQLLGISPKATAAEVRRAYKIMVRDLHPDAHPQASASERHQLEERFAAVTYAYRQLIPNGH